MKPTKVRNFQIYRASYATKGKQLGCPLTKELRKKYRKRSIRVIIGDTVKVLRGEYRGIDGKVSKILTNDRKLTIEGIKKEKSKGEKFDIFIPTYNVIITDLNLDDHWRKTKLQGKKPKTTPKEAKKDKLEEKSPEQDLTKKEIKNKKIPRKKSDEIKKIEPKNVTQAQPQKNKKGDGT
jgi:large subunit ribosomal protein L24